MPLEASVRHEIMNSGSEGKVVWDSTVLLIILTQGTVFSLAVKNDTYLPHRNVYGF